MQQFMEVVANHASDTLIVILYKTERRLLKFLLHHK